MLRLARYAACFLLLAGVAAMTIVEASAATFKVGCAQRDITPTKPMPLWGYGARHGILSQGVLDPLHAKAIVIDVGNEKNTIQPHLTTVLVNGELALVGASGEFFCDHGNRLKARSRAKKTLFFGCCNGHHMYFPTIEGAADGGYGADATISWVALGAGEQMMDKAIINIHTMLGRYKPEIPGGEILGVRQ